MLERVAHTQQETKAQWQDQSLQIQLSDTQWAAVLKSRSQGPLIERFSVRLADGGKVKILGKASFDEEKRILVFVPRFPIDPGTQLEIEVKSILNAKFTLPGKTKKKKSTVTQIYPTGDVLPANLLKFYIHFSQPMQKGNIYQNFSIFDLQKEKNVEIPFLELEEELWSRDGKRLTLFFDPGRIKRGLKPRQDLGPVFLPGKKYQFRISGEWKDENGFTLGEDVVKTFSTSEEDHSPPTYQSWKIKNTNNREDSQTVIQFDEPLDSALCRRVIQLEADGRPIQLRASKIGAGEQQLTLTTQKRNPKEKWVLVIGAELEDLCGNRIGKPFDFNPKRDKPPIDAKSFRIEF